MKNLTIKIQIGLLILICNCNTLFGQPKQTRWTKEEVSHVTIYLGDSINNSSGTGTIIGHQNRFFILTANHVATKINKGGFIIFQKNNIPIKHTLLGLTNNYINWLHHKTADISWIEIFPKDSTLLNLLNKWNFPLEQVYIGNDLPSMDNIITFLGYPVVNYKHKYFSPLVFQANISSGLLTQKRYDTKTLTTFFFLSEPSIQGCSGSAVFYSIIPKTGVFVGGEKTLIIGVMHGTHGDISGGKMAAVTPTFYLKDIIN